MLPVIFSTHSPLIAVDHQRVESLWRYRSSHIQAFAFLKFPQGASDMRADDAVDRAAV